MSIRPKRPTFSHELKLFIIGAERIALLGELVTEARADLRPRNFAERHLVDELAISKWRTYRVALMERPSSNSSALPFAPVSPAILTATCSCRTRTFITSPWRTLPNPTPSSSPRSAASTHVTPVSSAPPCAS